ncbi:MAG: cellulase family glycosylhydrolase [Rhizobiales bacterium]|nr:cellulase family glycosylhydrolase [Hyphomicrobiales bacterium]
MIGMNLAGAEFGNGSRYGYDYIYPTAEELDYFKAEGMDLIRLPFRWERVQPALGGELNPEEVGRIVTFLNEAQARGIHVVLDVHNYGRYNGQVIGSDIVPVSAFGDFWSKLSSALKDHPAIYGFGLMNETHDMG